MIIRITDRNDDLQVKVIYLFGKWLVLAKDLRKIPTHRQQNTIHSWRELPARRMIHFKSSSIDQRFTFFFFVVVVKTLANVDRIVCFSQQPSIIIKL